MRKTIIVFSVLGALIGACTKEKTNYKEELETVVPDSNHFREVARAQHGDYVFSLEAQQGSLYTGYNAIRLRVSGAPFPGSAATLLPVHTDGQGHEHSGPHLHALEYVAEGPYFSGYAVFTSPSSAAGRWTCHVSTTIGGQSHNLPLPVTVEPQPNENRHHIAFSGKDGRQYLIALVEPQNPQVGENDLVAGIYRYDEDESAYTSVDGYTLLLDPRMPEASMGNHSSPNNRDLTQRDDGFYQGVVNYTMTGNWTLNFILLDPDGQVLKGTSVPPDFTPGVVGTKSELHIDISF